MAPDTIPPLSPAHDASPSQPARRLARQGLYPSRGAALTGVALVVLILACNLVGNALYEHHRTRIDLAHGYLTWTLLLALAVYLTPKRLTEPLIAGSGIAYLAWSVSIPFAASCVVAVLLLHGILAAARRSRLAVLAYLLWVVGLNVSIARHLFTVFTPESFIGFLVAETIMGWLLSRILKRSTYALYELRIGRVQRVPLLSLMSYMIGLPANGSFSCTPSLRHFLDARSDDPQVREAVIWRGVMTTAACMACLYAFLAMYLMTWGGYPLFFRPAYAEQYDLWPRHQLWIMVLAFELFYFLQRMATEQLSVGTWRLLGYDLGDSFRARALLAPSVTGYWKHWNIPWNEFLASSIYYPVLLTLGRRAGRSRPWMHGLAGTLTMLGGTVFDLLPRALFFVGHMTTDAKEFLLSIVIYHLLWAVLLGATLCYQAAYPQRDTRWQLLTPLWVVLTYAAVSWCRIFEQAWSLDAKLNYILRAFGVH